MNSPSSIGRKAFPRIATLIDTGQRRHPTSGEYYYWQDDDGMVHGPHRAVARADEGDFIDGPDRYAIYRVVVDDGRMN